MTARPFLIEERADDFGAWTERWMCEPPPIEARYQVIRQQWDADYTIRTIYEIRLAAPDGGTKQ